MAGPWPSAGLPRHPRRAEHLVGVLGEELDDPGLVDRVHQGGEGGRALGCLQQCRPEHWGQWLYLKKYEKVILIFLSFKTTSLYITLNMCYSVASSSYGAFFQKKRAKTGRFLSQKTGEIGTFGEKNGHLYFLSFASSLVYFY